MHMSELTVNTMNCPLLPTIMTSESACRAAVRVMEPWQYTAGFVHCHHTEHGKQ